MKAPASLLAALLTLAAPAMAQSQPAVPPAGPTAFGTALQLTRAAATFDSTYFYPATYQFTIKIPPEAQQALARVTIALPDNYGPAGGQLPDPRAVTAFLPTEPEAQRPQSPERLLPARVRLENQAVVIDFNEPVPAGQILTVQFDQMRKPRLGGTYLFDVNALPAGPRPVSQFVGFGRLVFREGGFRFP